MTPLDGVLLLLCWLGSFAFCVAAFNRLHAIGISRRFRRKLEILLIFTLPLLSLFYLWRVVFAGASRIPQMHSCSWRFR